MREPPRIVVTGLARAGVGLMSDMLRAGGATFVTAVDPHKDFPLDAFLPRKTIGLWIERDALAIQMSHLKVQNVGVSDAKTNRYLRETLASEAREARDVAAKLFAPVFTFRFDQLLDDPAAQAMRLARMFWPGNNLTDLGAPACPAFEPRAAALAVRRICIPPDRRSLRLIHSINQIPERA